ncbi:MAG TPA: CorA family divalent cation transporter [Pyrinomonadaceae bacterium]|nr:CorA family divalent cation transporter [Pyrinomonadaceae bacterium]
MLIDFLVGKNFVVTVSDCKIGYFDELREREQDETNIGELDAESFVGSLLDLHIVTYFRALEKIEAEVDALDEKILNGETKYEEFLAEMVKLRSNVSKLRRWFLPHRDVFYALSRPHFFTAEDSDASEYFKILSEHFDNAVDVIESSRDTVIGLFDLYAAKANEKTNQIVQRLTYITVIVGFLGVVAGALGMNFTKLDFFEHDYGFWIIIGAMVAFAAVFTAIAYWRKWV